MISAFMKKELLEKHAPFELEKTVALIGLMGCGKSATGKRLAKALGVAFCDLDTEIEKQEGLSVTDIFAKYGEPYFREKEKEVLEKLLGRPPFILATGGGAFMTPIIRETLLEKSCTVWLNANFDILLERVSRKKTRPILERGNKAEILKSLMDERYPVYSQAEIEVQSTNAPHHIMIGRMIDMLKEHGIVKENA